MSEYHVPVLLQECIDALNIKQNGTYVDVTFGGGGHSRAILEQLGADGKLVAFDQDEDALQNIPDDIRLQFAHSDYRYLKRFLRLYGCPKVDGILADFGVSSHQFDQPERGFSFRFDADLDMRMNQASDRKAVDIIQGYSAAELQEIFGKYGEVRNAKTLAQHLVSERHRRKINTTFQLVNAIEPMIRGQRNRYLAQVFQALRIEVNEELASIEAFLEAAAEVLLPGGRLVVISYHSLEDRMVKNFLKTGNVSGKPVKDFYGNLLKPLDMITRKPILPDQKEIQRNPKSRSARLRVGERRDD